MSCLPQKPTQTAAPAQRTARLPPGDCPNPSGGHGTGGGGGAWARSLCQAHKLFWRMYGQLCTGTMGKPEGLEFQSPSSECLAETVGGGPGHSGFVHTVSVEGEFGACASLFHLAYQSYLWLLSLQHQPLLDLPGWLPDQSGARRGHHPRLGGHHPHECSHLFLLHGKAHSGFR